MHTQHKPLPMSLLAAAPLILATGAFHSGPGDSTVSSGVGGVVRHNFQVPVRRVVALVALSAFGACDEAPQSSATAVAVNPPLAVGTDTIPANEVRAYLEATLGFTSRGGQVFCSYEVLGQEGNRVFLATACEELVQAADSLESGSGSGRPVALALDPTESPLRIVEHEVPGDGNRYAPDVERIFPVPVQRQILAPTDEHNRRAAALRAANLNAARAHFLEPGIASSATEAGPDPRHPGDLVRAAEAIVGFLRGEVGFEQIRLADTVALCLGREGGGTCTEVSRSSLQTPARWLVRSDELRMTYPVGPAPWQTKLTTGVGVHYRCLGYSLAADFPELARLPHVGTKLEPPDASSCLQSWNLTLVFAADESSPALVAAVYDQWEW
jgi:hypothetical protein